MPKINFSLITPDVKNTSFLKPVTNVNVIDPVTNRLDEGGFYSNDIFSVIGSKARKETFSFIELGVSIMHPYIYDILMTLSSLYPLIISGKKKAIWDDKIKDFIESMDEDASTGYSFFVSKIYQLKLVANSSVERQEKISVFNKYQERKQLTFKKHLILPAGLREYTSDNDGNITEDEITDMYRRLFNSAAGFLNLRLDVKDMYLVDNSRYRLQVIVQEIYTYFIQLQNGKNKFMNGKWAKVAIDFGTGNVLTSIPVRVNHLLDDSNSSNDLNSTIMGIYQYSVAMLPYTIHYLNSIVVDRLFSPDGLVTLVDPKILQSKQYKIKAKTITNWTTQDGVLSIIKKLFKDDFKDTPISLEGKYLLMVSEKGNNITIHHDVGTYDGDKDKLRPLTYGELFYIIGTMSVNDSVGFMKRYPISNSSSTYPSNVNLYSTADKRSVKLTMLGQEHNIVNYPINKSIWVNSVSVHYSKISDLGADFDGDMTYWDSLLMDDSIKEVKGLMNDIKFYIGPDGKMKSSLVDDIVTYTINTVTKGYSLDKVYDKNELIDNPKEFNVTKGK